MEWKVILGNFLKNKWVSSIRLLAVKVGYVVVVIVF